MTVICQYARVIFHSEHTFQILLWQMFLDILIQTQCSLDTNTVSKQSNV